MLGQWFTLVAITLHHGYGLAILLGRDTHSEVIRFTCIAESHAAIHRVFQMKWMALNLCGPPRGYTVCGTREQLQQLGFSRRSAMAAPALKQEWRYRFLKR